MKKNVVVIFGGNSSEYEISLKSGMNIFAEIDGDRYNKYLMRLRGRSWTVVEGDREYPVDKNDFSFIKNGYRIGFDYAYITIHGNPGENGMLQGYLDMMGLPYSTSSLLVTASTFDKHFCNNYIRGFGYRVPDSVFLKEEGVVDEEEIVEKLGLPCFVKPNAEGSSFGISKVNRREELRPAIEKAFGKGREVLIEEFIDGREFTCGIYRAGNKKTVFPLAEVVSFNEFFDYDAKYDPQQSDEIIPARFTQEVTDKIKDRVSALYDLLGCSGIIRVDGILRGEEMVILDINTTPGMTSNSFVPKMIRSMGMELKDVLNDIIGDKLGSR